ncbi:acyltransferase [Paenibacillus lautus]|uniref:acyltransferase family protein n=1 Tax=Paenibacillus lautus TaxID=1401 RepID=UPI001B2C41CC|nr:acyltransferase family protein [Paenibacillus lautus]GIO99239.1 acyltransferase [Paenibacillus lautus]
MPKPLKGNGRYMPGLDGLRAFAVLAVIVYHLDSRWAPGGLLGVGVFFVLSGYLITDILIAQWKRDGRLGWKGFWLRRIRRLMPALLVMIAVVVAWITLFDHSQLASVHGDVLSALLYVNNWWRIYHEVSYFSSFGPPSPFGHFWSLAVEEQFYLLWPLLLVIGLRFVTRWRLLGLTLLLAFLSALAMALIYEPGSDPSRVYYGTDTRAFALLIGAALAMVWPSRKLTVKAAPRARLIFDCIGGAGLMTIVVMIGLTDQYDSFLYRGGFVLLSVATAIVVAVLAHPVSRLGKVMGCQPLRWLGVRSYGIYLWHYPVIILTRPEVNTGETSIVRSILQVGISIVLAALSWRFIEEPIRKGGFGYAWGQFRRWGTMPVLGRMASVCMMLVLTICAIGMTGVTSDTKPGSVSYERNDFQTGTIQPGSIPKPNGSKQPYGTLKPDAGQKVTAIGDSVLLDIAPYLQEHLPGITIDGKVGRQMSQAKDVIDQHKSKGELGDVVIVALGTNGTFSEKTLFTLLDSLENVQQILLVNIRVPRPWERDVNSTLAETSKQFSNVTLVDWYMASSDKDSYFSRDGVHLGEEGAKAYASLIAEAIKP